MTSSWFMVTWIRLAIMKNISWWVLMIEQHYIYYVSLVLKCMTCWKNLVVNQSISHCVLETSWMIWMKSTYHFNLMCTSQCVFIIKDEMIWTIVTLFKHSTKRWPSLWFMKNICHCHIHNTQASPLPITPPPNTPSHCIKI